MNSVTTELLAHRCGRVIVCIGSVLEGATNLQRLFQEFRFLFVFSEHLLSACGSKYRSFMYETHTGLCGLSHECGFIIFINCNWVITRWKWLFYVYTNMGEKSN